MTSTEILHSTVGIPTYSAPRALATHHNQVWTIRPLRRTDVAELKVLFRKLHAFNSALDARFALSEAWETPFEAAIETALRGETLCLLACEPCSDQPHGFALAAVHHDSNMWRFHEWVEVEALYMDDDWRGSGLAEMLLTHTCDWAESIGQSVIQLYVTTSNERAIRFYHHEGFGETQAVMRKVLA